MTLQNCVDMQWLHCVTDNADCWIKSHWRQFFRSFNILKAFDDNIANFGG